MAGNDQAMDGSIRMAWITSPGTTANWWTDRGFWNRPSCHVKRSGYMAAKATPNTIRVKKPKTSARTLKEVGSMLRMVQVHFLLLFLSSSPFDVVDDEIPLTFSTETVLEMLTGSTYS